MSFLAIFILTGCTNNVAEIKQSDTNAYHHNDEKPFTIADVEALSLKEETASQKEEEVMITEEPIVVLTPNSESDFNTTELVEEVTIAEEATEPTVVSTPEPKPKVEKTKPVEEVTITEEHVVVPTPKPKSDVKKTQPAEVATLNYYIQVSSFLKYPPSKKFLASISTLGYPYKFHEVTNNSTTTTKVLVGPFPNALKARDAGRILRAKIEPGAFLVKR